VNTRSPSWIRLSWTVADRHIATPANIGMAAHGKRPDEFAVILDERATWAAVAHRHGIEPVR
jgi:hypothetical protein